MTILAPNRHRSHAGMPPAPPPAATRAPYGGATILAEPGAGAKLLPGATTKAMRDLAARLIHLATTIEQASDGRP